MERIREEKEEKIDEITRRVRKRIEEVERESRRREIGRGTMYITKKLQQNKGQAT